MPIPGYLDRLSSELGPAEPGPDTESTGTEPRHRERGASTERAPGRDRESAGPRHRERRGPTKRVRERQGPTQRVLGESWGPDTDPDTHICCRIVSGFRGGQSVGLRPIQGPKGQCCHPA